MGANYGECNRCRQPLRQEASLGLFGLGFEEVNAAELIAVMTALGELKEDAGTSNLPDEPSGSAGSGATPAAQDTEEIVDSDVEVVEEECPEVSDAPRVQVPAETQLDDTQATAPPEVEEPTGDATATGTGAVAAPPATAAPTAEVAKKVAQICKQKQQLRQKRKGVVVQRVSLDKVALEAQKQRDKLRAAERARSKHETECNRHVAEVQQCEERRATMGVQLNSVRQRDAVLEYWEDLRSRSSKDAFGFISRTVSLVSNPWKILTEVARLRDYHRGRLAEREKVGVQAARRKDRDQREHDEVKKVVDELKSKVQQLQQRRGSVPVSAVNSEFNLPDPKRPRTIF